MFELQIFSQHITVQEHFPGNTALTSLTFTSHASPTPAFKPNGMIVQLVIITISDM